MYGPLLCRLDLQPLCAPTLQPDSLKRLEIEPINYADIQYMKKHARHSKLAKSGVNTLGM